MRREYFSSFIRCCLVVIIAAIIWLLPLATFLNLSSASALAASNATKKISSDSSSEQKTVSSERKTEKKSATKADKNKKKSKAATNKAKRQSKAARKRLKRLYGARPSAQSADKFAAVVVDTATGNVLYEKNADALRYPASLTKMMTLYLTFDALKKNKLRLQQEIPVSKKASEQPQTNVNLSAGDRISVDDAIKALVVRSANDVSVVLAEKIGGTTWNFAQLMTQKARDLGMRDTVFRNPNGLPDDGQYTNAYDMARLGIALRRDFPEYYSYFKTERFDFRGITYTTHNRVLLRYDGADGIKTGYIRASGFNLVTSVKKNGHSLVAVIMGGSSGTARDDMMIRLLDRTFAAIDSGKKKNVAGSEESNSDEIIDDKNTAQSASLSAAVN